jgi:hypothetical protein
MCGVSRDIRGQLRRAAVFVFVPIGGSPAAGRKLRDRQRSAAVYNDRRAPRFSVRQSAGGYPPFRNADRTNQTSRRHGVRARKITGIYRSEPPRTPRRHAAGCLPACSACLVCSRVASHSPPARRFRQESQSIPAPALPRAAACALVFSLIFTSSRCSARGVNFVGRNSLAPAKAEGKRIAPLRHMRRITRPIGRSCALRTRNTERIARVENNRRIRDNST